MTSKVDRYLSKLSEYKLAIYNPEMDEDAILEKLDDLWYDMSEQEKEQARVEAQNVL